MRSLVWYRGKELRVSDHEPLWRAAESGEVACLFVLDPYFFAQQRAAGLPHRMQFLLQSLRELEADLLRLGLRLLVLPGKSLSVVPRVARELAVDRVLCQRWVEPFGRKRDRLVQEQLDVPLELLEGETLVRPGSLRSSSQSAYVTYTPFAKALLQGLDVPAPKPPPRSIRALPLPDSLRSVPIPRLDDLGLVHRDGIQMGGSSAGSQRMETFMEERLKSYAGERDFMAKAATSRLSADLKFGTVSPRQVYGRLRSVGSSDRASEKFLSELLWREFSHSTLWDFPFLLERPFRKEFQALPYRRSPEDLAAFQEGRTGYPIVDAAARQLLLEGYVENRARMIAASFLTKHLFLPYWEGEAHYMKYLTDGDWAQNNFGWQWSAGCGVGAQPYFRMMSPMSQAEKFDPNGDYVRRYVPELAALPSRSLVAPWEVPPLELERHGIRLGRDYPHPIVDHRRARKRYLETMKRALGRSSSPS